MPTRIDFSTLAFAQPFYLHLLAVPAALFVLWVGQLFRRRADLKRLAHAHVLPARQTYPRFGELGFWFFAIVAASLCIAALAQPQARVTGTTRGAVDIVILQDGSASMYVTDSKPDRWRRSVRFLRTFADSMSWRSGDRAALALFAYFAAPQVRLTTDPNALFFFLDHLGEQSPFRLEDDPTWDTNIGEGIYWGLQLLKTDKVQSGPNTHVKAFVVISDGQAWSGDVAAALKAARAQDVAVYVVGVGTTAGGLIPEPRGAGTPAASVPTRAVLDRSSLRAIATAGGGEYFEIDREADRDIALAIISALKRRAPLTQTDESRRDVYWGFLLAAGCALCAGTLMLKQRAELWWQVAGVVIAILVIALTYRVSAPAG